MKACRTDGPGTLAEYNQKMSKKHESLVGILSFSFFTTEPDEKLKVKPKLTNHKQTVNPL